MKGIEKGEILNSGVPQSTKDGSVGRGSIDHMQSRRIKLGTAYIKVLFIMPVFCLDTYLI